MADTKKKVVKSSPPDRTEHEDMMAQIQKEINAHYAQLTEINKKIGEKSTGKEEFIRRKEDMKVKLQEYQTIISKHEEAKKKHWDEIKTFQNVGNEMRNDMKKMKSASIPGLAGFNAKSIDQIDEKLAEIEYKMQTTSMTLQEEKKCMEQMNALKKAKPQFETAQKLHQSVGDGQASVVAPLKEKINEISKLIQEAREAKKQQMAQYQKLIEQRSKVTSEMPALFEKRDGINKQLGNAHMHRKALIEDFRRKEKEYNAHLSEVRQLKYDKQRADRLERQADNQSKAIQSQESAEEEQPFLFETTLIDQCVAYCQNLLKEPESKTESSGLVIKTEGGPEGSKALVPKGHRDEEMFFKGKGKKKALKSAAIAAKGPKERSDDDKIKHTIDSLECFAKVKVAAPIKYGDLEATVEKLKKERSKYDDKIKKWTDDKETRAKQQAKNLAEAQVKLDQLRAQAREAREQAKKKDGEVAAKTEEEEAE